MKLLTTALFLVLSIAAVRAQIATVNPPASPLAGLATMGYLAVFPQAPLITVRFDGNSADIAKVVTVPQSGTSYNHDGTAFKGYVRSTSSESYNDSVVDYAQFDRDVAEFKKNVKSGKWRGFINGE